MEQESLIIFLFSSMLIALFWFNTVYAVKNTRYPIGYLVLSIAVCILNLFALIDRDKKIVELNDEIECYNKFFETYSVKEVEDDNPNYIEVTGTYYNPCASQCDEDFLLTASNDSIDMELLNKHQLKWIAVSRDLLETFNFDDTIIVVSNNYRINGEWIIKDVMSSKWKNRIDFLVPFNDTLQIGKSQMFIYKK